MNIVVTLTINHILPLLPDVNKGEYHQFDEILTILHLHVLHFIEMKIILSKIGCIGNIRYSILQICI